MSTTVFPTGGRSVVEQMCAKFPELHVNDDAKQRDLITKIQQQFVYQYGASWGGKKRTGLSDAEKSKDSMAFLEPSGACSTWDTFQGNTEATILVQDGAPPDFADMPASEATFMAVAAYDWLGDDETETETEPPPSNQAVEAILEALEQLQTSQDNDTAQILERSDANTQRIVDQIDGIKTQVEESLQKALAILIHRKRDDAPVA